MSRYRQIIEALVAGNETLARDLGATKEEIDVLKIEMKGWIAPGGPEAKLRLEALDATTSPIKIELELFRPSEKLPEGEEDFLQVAVLMFLESGRGDLGYYVTADHFDDRWCGTDRYYKPGEVKFWAYAPEFKEI